MTANRDNLEAWLEQAQHGDLDALTPEQVAALEAAEVDRGRATSLNALLRQGATWSAPG